MFKEYEEKKSVKEYEEKKKEAEKGTYSLFKGIGHALFLSH